MCDSESNISKVSLSVVFNPTEVQLGGESGGESSGASGSSDQPCRHCGLSGGTGESQLPFQPLCFLLLGDTRSSSPQVSRLNCTVTELQTLLRHKDDSSRAYKSRTDAQVNAQLLSAEMQEGEETNHDGTVVCARSLTWSSSSWTGRTT